ncbi:helix-turn-helix domain-containing protein [Paenibacillus cymbidii]|uniref:helix-turn-helix domain-containing protein n=1 Tax=Paenibacillus cymbidii TaxID=1639034 RepID=UPI001436A0F5|nr:helix-turn-helix domain-containing protein [Paenibacillus cymbidii]
MDKMKRFVRFMPRLKMNSLFVKIWLYFLSLLIPTIVIGFVFYFNFVDKVKHEFAGKIAIHLQSAANTVDIHLGTIQGVNQNLLVNEVVNRVLIPNSQMTIQEKAELVKLIQVLNNAGSIMNNLIDFLFVYVDGERVYTPTSSEKFASFFATSYRYERYTAADWLEKLHSEQMIEIVPQSAVESYGVPRKPVVPFITTGLIRGNKAVAVANISVEMVQGALLGNDMFPATRFLVTDAGDNLIIATGGLNADIAGELKRIHTDKAAAVGKVEIGGQTYMTAFDQSNIYGWQYYALTPVSEFNRQAAGVLNLIILICSVLLVIGFALSFIFAYRIYNPIKKIRDVLVANEGMEEGAFPHSAKKNALMALGDGVHELYRANETYRSKLTIATLNRLEHALLQLLRGNRIEGEHEVAARLNEHFGFRAGEYLVGAILFEFKAPFYRDIQDVDRFVILGKLKKLITGLLREFVPVYVLEYDRQQFACIVNMDDNGDAALTRALDNLMRTFAYDALFCIIHVGVGSRCSKLSGIGKSYNEAMTALHNRDQSLDFQVIDAQSLEIEHRFYYSFADENKIWHHLKKGDFAETEEAIREVLRRNETRNVSHRNIHMLLAELYNTSLRYATERGMDDLSFVTEEEHHLLSGITGQTADVETKLQLILKVYRQLSGHQLPPQDNRTGATVSSIIHYIEENFATDLYLEKIAMEVGISSKYVSRMFKEKTGVNLTDYISMYRMTKAKELLVQTNLSINEIAERVGIFSRATFLRIFKKFEGVSPNEFRKSNT